jgi:hypothetical protein
MNSAVIENRGRYLEKRKMNSRDVEKIRSCGAS